jgi:AraC-like DNA-binding protein
LSQLGIAPRRAFARARVPLRAFKNPESRIAFEALGRLFCECVALTRCEHFGLLVGERFELDGLGALGYLMRNSATVGDALRALLLHLHLHDRGAAPVLIWLEPSSVLLGYSIYRFGTPGMAYLYDAAVAIGYRLLRTICGPKWKPLYVQLSHGRPENIHPYRRVFGPNIRFDGEISGIIFAAEWLDGAIPGADPLLRELIAQSISQIGAIHGMTFADQVRAVMHQMVFSGAFASEDVARLFGIHERTLRKRLTAEQTSLQQIVSQTRFELAKQLLSNTQLAFTDVAAALHYADAAVFSRAFRGWANMSPRAWRGLLHHGFDVR